MLVIFSLLSLLILSISLTHGISLPRSLSLLLLPRWSGGSLLFSALLVREAEDALAVEVQRALKEVVPQETLLAITR